MTKKRKIPNYSCYELADRFCLWLKSKSSSPIFGRNLSPAGNNYVQRSPEEPGVYMKLTSENICVQQIVYFREYLKKNSSADKLSNLEVEVFSVDAEGDAGKYYEFLYDQRKKFQKKELRKYNAIFGEPKVSFEQKDFVFSNSWREHFCGIGVRVPLKKIPLGSGGKLSDNLFEYLESGIAKPVRKGIRK